MLVFTRFQHLVNKTPMKRLFRNETQLSFLVSDCFLPCPPAAVRGQCWLRTVGVPVHCGTWGYQGGKDCRQWKPTST